jgi:hypothetical protein
VKGHGDAKSLAVGCGGGIDRNGRLLRDVAAVVQPIA